MPRKPGPCKGCKKRHEACWSNCKEYKDYRAELDEENRKKKEFANKQYITNGIKQVTKKPSKLRLYSLQGKARANRYADRTN
jgi:hypothetical protein